MQKNIKCTDPRIRDVRVANASVDACIATSRKRTRTVTFAIAHMSHLPNIGNTQHSTMAARANVQAISAAVNPSQASNALQQHAHNSGNDYALNSVLKYMRVRCRIESEEITT